MQRLSTITEKSQTTTTTSSTTTEDGTIEQQIVDIFSSIQGPWAFIFYKVRNSTILLFLLNRVRMKDSDKTEFIAFWEKHGW